jgi:hypothetical protein
VTYTINRPLSLTLDESRVVYDAFAKWVEDMGAYLTWLKDQDRRPLPGQETAVAEVTAEIARLRKMQLRLYEKGQR